MNIPPLYVRAAVEHLTRAQEKDAMPTWNTIKAALPAFGLGLVVGGLAVAYTGMPRIGKLTGLPAPAPTT